MDDKDATQANVVLKPLEERDLIDNICALCFDQQHPIWEEKVTLAY